VRLPLVLLCSLLVVPAAFAASRANGDGVFELNSVNAQRVVIAGTRGAIWGQIDKGTLRVTDLNADDSLFPQVSGAEQVIWSPFDPTVTTYIGKNIHFRFSGAKYRFTITQSTGVDVTAVGVGQAWLVGDPDALDTGYYAIDDGKWTSVPLLKKAVTFGVQPVVAGP
jgi:hypothetical protein